MNYVHVAQVRNINNVVVNNARKPRKYKGLRVFSWIQFFCIFKPKIDFRYLFRYLSPVVIYRYKSLILWYNNTNDSCKRKEELWKTKYVPNAILLKQ